MPLSPSLGTAGHVELDGDGLAVDQRLEPAELIEHGGEDLVTWRSYSRHRPMATGLAGARSAESSEGFAMVAPAAIPMAPRNFLR